MPPSTYKALVVTKSGKTYGSKVVEHPIKSLNSGEIRVRMTAAAFNHRDLWIKKGQYGGIGVGNTFGADGCGFVVESAKKDDPLLNRRVFVLPMVGWESSPLGPESKAFSVVGGVLHPDFGTMTEMLVVDRNQVLEAPHHLSDVEVAAWPLAGLTAWRAVTVKGGVTSGSNVLITGIGGGVALTALQLCVALKANVFVTTGNDDKLKLARKLGTKGGANYKNEKWANDIKDLLEGELLDVVIDSAGGDILTKTLSILKPGARVVCYGMTASPQIKMSMREVMRNIELKGSTMGSRADMIEATKFIAERLIVPVVSKVIDGLEKAEEGFEDMRAHQQFGKIVIRMNDDSRSKL